MNKIDKYSVKNEHENELKALFKKYEGLDIVSNRGFASSDELHRNALLFIGINPSYSEKEADNEKSYFYNLLQEKNAYQKYFRRFEDISKKVNHKWTHLDLFYFRHTNQKHVYYYLSSSNDSIDFATQQLKITKNIIENITPKVIVVSNALARDLFGAETPKGLGFNYFFDDEIGTHRIKDSNSPLNDTPVFFTSMLTGTRALDNGSYERLVWQIKQVLKVLS